MMPVYWLGERLRLWKTRGYARDQLGLEIIDDYRRLETVAEPDELVQVIVAMFDAELWGSEKPSILAEKVVEKLKDAAARWAQAAYRELRRARDEKYKQRVLDDLYRYAELGFSEKRCKRKWFDYECAEYEEAYKHWLSLIEQTSHALALLGLAEPISLEQWLEKTKQPRPRPAKPRPKPQPAQRPRDIIEWLKAIAHA